MFMGQSGSLQKGWVVLRLSGGQTGLARAEERGVDGVGEGGASETGLEDVGEGGGWIGGGDGGLGFVGSLWSVSRGQRGLAGAEERGLEVFGDGGGLDGGGEEGRWVIVILSGDAEMEEALDKVL